MKKHLLIALMSVALSACTHTVYSATGNATILSSKEISPEVVELVVKKDSGEVVTMSRKYDAHAAVGARVRITENYEHKDSDLTTIRRYEFK